MLSRDDLDERLLRAEERRAWNEHNGLSAAHPEFEREREALETARQLGEWVDELTWDYGRPGPGHARAYNAAVAWLEGGPDEHL